MVLHDVIETSTIPKRVAVGWWYPHIAIISDWRNLLSSQMDHDLMQANCQLGVANIEQNIFPTIAYIVWANGIFYELNIISNNCTTEDKVILQAFMLAHLRVKDPPPIINTTSLIGPKLIRSAFVARWAKFGIDIPCALIQAGFSSELCTRDKLPSYIGYPSAISGRIDQNKRPPSIVIHDISQKLHVRSV